MIAERARSPGLGHGLIGAPDRAGDQEERSIRPALRRFHRQLEHRLVEAELADRELGRVDADREPARAGVEVVAGERPLTSPVEAAVRVQGERMRGNDGAGAEHGEDVLRDLAPVHRLPELRRGCGADKGGIAEAAVVLERHPGKRPLFLESAAREQLRDVRLTVGDVDQHRPGDGGERRLEQPERRRGLGRHDGADVRRGATPARQEEASRWIVPRQRARALEKILEESRPVGPERGGVELGDALRPRVSGGSS